MTDSVSSECRLCQCRSRRDEQLVALELYPGPRLEIYCCECYEHLWVEASPHMPELPPLIQLETETSQLQVPEYLVKDNSLFQLFFPSDPINLGVLRQQRRRERGQLEKEGKR